MVKAVFSGWKIGLLFNVKCDLRFRKDWGILQYTYTCTITWLIVGICNGGMHLLELSGETRTRKKMIQTHRKQNGNDKCRFFLKGEGSFLCFFFFFS